MFDLSSPYAPFLTFAIFIAVANAAQALFLTYKFSKGYGLLFPGKKLGESFENLLVGPQKASGEERTMLMVTILVFFSSVYIIWRIVRTLPLT